MRVFSRLQLKIMIVALRKSRVRLLLALATVGLGIASMMVMLALGTGAERELQAITDRIGKNLFMIKAGRIQGSPGRGGGWFSSTRLTTSDVEVLVEQISGIRAIVPIAEGALQAQFERRAHSTTVRGVTDEFLELRRFRVADGRAFDMSDDLERSRVAVVGPHVANQLNEGLSMVGETIWIDGIPFEVIGQLAEKGFYDGQNEDDQILMPLGTALRRLFNVDYLSQVLVQIEQAEHMAAIQQETKEVLRETHDLDQNVEDDFEILSLIRVNRIREMNSTFLGGLAQLFAVVTLTIGGAGVLAVTFLNVKDRTSEIGLRMAVGARRKDVANLFVVEACLLSLMGGFVGLVIGWASIAVLEQVTTWKMAIDVRGVTIPLLVSLLLGLVFGVVPAIKASKVMPVEALRYG